MYKNGLFAGSFDPFTTGHYDIAVRASKLFDKLYIGVADDTGNKRCIATLAERVKIAESSVADIPNAVVCPFSGLLTDFAAEKQIFAVVRGLRSSEDLDYESALAAVYKSQLADIEAIFLIAQPSLAHVSSDAVRSLFRLGGKLDGYLCKPARDLIEKIYGKRS